MKNKSTSKYAPIRKRAEYIAEVCGCSGTYVRQIFDGERKTGTQRAVLAAKVIAQADKELARYKEDKQLNN